MMSREEKERLYLENKNLIHTALKPYRPNLKKIEDQTGFSYDDLFQECSLYFLRLIDRYQPDKGNLSTFVVKSLNLYISTVILKHSTFFSVPLDVKRNHFRMINLNIQHLDAKSISSRMNITETAAKKAKNFVAAHLSLDSIYSPAESDGDVRLLDYLRSDDFTDSLIFDIFLEQFQDSMLTSHEKKTMRLLIDGYHTHEIADSLSVSKTTVNNYVRIINTKFKIMSNRYLVSITI